MSSTDQRTAKTRARLLQAAIEVFSTAGINGATTREIARVAGVNEVTLFRHFQTKEQLLSAVTQTVSALQAEALEDREEWTQDLRLDLIHYAHLYNDMLEEHEDLIRTFIGESKRHPEAAQKIVQEAAQNLREKLLTYLSHAQERGAVQTDINLRLAIDQLTGMLLSGMLRRSVSPHLISYSQETYIEGCVDLLICGIISPSHSMLRPNSSPQVIEN